MREHAKQLANALYGVTPKGCCVKCKRPAIAFKDTLSQKEYSISGLCQTCQDVIFNDEANDE